ncbi:DNA polymerase IV [Mesorhizobium sp. LCM 4577]|uniref:DNA polymerase IV n=1 Tax=Mesorhizobium plurifarium TaxID=69974 RepID=A0A090GT19_MESPL|nr:DNA polymerase IV [Mesorhizobium sp. LCM 4577]OHV68949.1 DNA polymerase IV [Mesorhizobium sp. LCM 4577]CDX51851.1 DNA polymerase IV [Mesorhizobium plurifarium]
MAPDRSADQRKIIHVDMDAFYASVEQRDNPELRGKPLAVGGAAERGVVAAASYEARAFGVRSAMASVTAKRKCPELVFVPPRFDVYRSVSAQIREVFAEHTDLIEPLSLDEAYLDVTRNRLEISSATTIAEMIRAKILLVTGLTASAGVSYNKFLAKMASGQNKPNGQFVITPRHGPAFVEALPVKKFHGVGPATAGRMEALGIKTGADLKDRSLAFLQQHFGRSGLWYYQIARAIDERAVEPDRPRKSIGAEDTFAADIFEFAAASAELKPLTAKVWGHCEGKGIRGRTITLKVKFADFHQITRSRTVSVPIELSDIERVAADLLKSVFPVQKGIRLLGVTLSSLGDVWPPEQRQLRFEL